MWWIFVERALIPGKKCFDICVSVLITVNCVLKFYSNLFDIICILSTVYYVVFLI